VRPLVLYGVLYLSTKSQTNTLSLSHTHNVTNFTHTHTMSQSSFGPSAGSSVRVTVIYSVPSISTDYT